MRRIILLPLLGSLALVAAPAPGRALTAVCTAGWAATVSPGGTATGPLSGASTPPCPVSTVTASVTVGTGANAGTMNPSGSMAGLATNAFSRSTDQSMDLGVLGGASENLVLTFTQAVPDPYLFFTFTDTGTSFTFSQPFVLVQSNNASVSGSTVTAAGGSNSVNDGFVVQMLGAYSTINFAYNNSTGSDQSVAFTAGTNAVPGPLPLMGAGVAFGFSRRLRRRIRA